ncbi:hypothetical protein C8T65DRAFT_744776 [Cerioporus squamosus]|nr:hypothetical protein C8T65DRAFT_744776 [Cerioporus squamosus]
MASDGERRVGLDVLIERVATRRRWSKGNNRLAPHYPRLIRKALSLEAQAHRVRFEGPIGAQDVVLTDDGIVFYEDWKEPEYQPYSILNLPQIETRAEVVFQYHSKARHLLDIQDLLKNGMPSDPRVYDVKIFPLLLRECLETVDDLRFTNAELSERINEGNVRVDRLETECVAAALLEDERVFGVKCMKMIKGCLANQRRARRLRIESREDGEVIVLTETGIEFFTYYGTVRALREGDRRLDCLNMNEIKKRTATFEQLLEEIQQVFEEFMPNQVGVLTPEMLADEIQQVFQEIARLSEQERHILGNDCQEWPAKFSDRLRFANKKYRHHVKQSLYEQHTQLLVLHTRADGPNPHKRLLDAVDLALTTCRTAFDLEKEAIDVLEGQGCDERKHFMLTRNLRRVEGVIKNLRDDDTYIRTTYKECEASILLFTPENLSRTLTVLHNRKPEKTTYFEDSAPLLSELVKLRDERDAVIEEMKWAGTVQRVVWISCTTGTITAGQLRSQIARFDGLEARIKATEASQSVLLNELEDLIHAAQSTPSTLPGPDGTEMPVSMVLEIIQVYERLLARCERVKRSAQSVVTDLKQVLLI